MALSRRTGQRFQASIWPGFVDAMTGLLLVLMFVLTIFMVVQFVLRETITGQESELNTLSAEIAAIAEALGMERDKVQSLETELGTLSATLDDTQSEVAAQSQLIAQLTQQRDDTATQLAQASQRIASFEEQVASLLAAQTKSDQQITTLEAEKVELLSQQEQLNLALATARSEIDSAAEEARRKASEREALDAYIASLEAEKADNESRIAQQSEDLVKLNDLLSEEEAARLVSSQVAQELRKQLETATAELTAMTLVLEEQRRKAEETLILLAAAEQAKADLDGMLQDTLLALEAANLTVDTQNRKITELETTGQKITAAYDQSEIALAAALARQQALETQISKLQAALEIAQGSDQQKANLLRNLQDQLAQNQDEVASLKQARQSAQSLMEKLQLQLSSALEDIARLNQDRLQKSDQNLALQDQLAQTREDLQLATDAAAAGQEKNATLEQNISALLLGLDQAEANLSRAEALSEQLGSQLQTAQGALRDEQAARAILISEAEALNQKLAQALVNLTAADADRNRAASDIEQLQDALRQQQQSSSDAQRSLEQELASAVADKLALDKQRAETQAQLAEALSALSRADQALDSAADDVARLENQLAVQQQAKDTRGSLEADLAAALAAKLDAEKDSQKIQEQLREALAAKLAADKLAETRLDESVERQILLDRARRKLTETSETLDKRTQDLLKAEKQSALLNQQVSALRQQLGQLQSLLEVSEELDASNKVQLQNLGNRLNAALARAAAEQRKRLKLEEAARKKLEEERNSLASQAEELAKYKSEFFGRLREVLAAEEGVRVVGDRFVFSSEVLFQPAQARLSGKGEDEITKVGRILQRVMSDIPDGIDWVIRVDGHTDNLPLSGTGRYRDNWELSQARALSVVKFMITELRIPAGRLAANGFGEFQPVNRANTVQARAQNRRIEIKLTER